MFNKAKLLTAGSAVMAVALVSTSANAATANADARATILDQITVTKTSDLDFGTIVVGATGGNATLSAASGAVNCAAALVCSGTTSAAAFSVAGTAGETVDITVDSTVNLLSGTDSMTASLASSDATLVLAGGDSFTVGGTLAVGANQATGDYVGNFDVTVNYQ